MRFVNLTPHDVVIYSKAGTEIARIEASGQVARVQTIDIPVGMSFDSRIPAVRSEWGEIKGLPKAEKGTIFIVSLVVFQASDRTDLARPDSGPSSVDRNNKGPILGVKRLVVK